MNILSAANNTKYYPQICTPGASLGPVLSHPSQVIEDLSAQILEHQQSSQKLDNVVVNLTEPEHFREDLETAEELIQQAEAVLTEKQATLLEQSNHLSKSDANQISLEQECAKMRQVIAEMKETLQERNLEKDSVQQQLQEIIQKNLPCSPQETEAKLTSMLNEFLDREKELKQYTTDVISLKYEKPSPSSSKIPSQLLLQEKLSSYRKTLWGMSKKTESLENLVQKALEQLGPGACNDQFRGESNRQLRKKIISLFSDIALYNLRLPQESLLIGQKITLLRAKHVKEFFDSHTKTIGSFKRSPEYVTTNWMWFRYEVKETCKGTYRDTTNGMLKTFNLLHQESLVVRKELKSLLGKIKPVEVHQNYPEVLAYGDKDQMQNNIANFAKFQKDIGENQDNLKNAIHTVYNDLLASHTEFRAQLAYLMYVTADNNPGMSIAIKGWRKLVTLDERELPSNLEKTNTPQENTGYLDWLWGSSPSTDPKPTSDPLLSSIVVIPARQPSIPVDTSSKTMTTTTTAMTTTTPNTDLSATGKIDEDIVFEQRPLF